MTRLPTCILLAALVTGCINDDGERTLEDVGGLCITGAGATENTSYVADASVTVHVVLEDCASGCASDITASCSVELDGSTLSVSASGSYQVPSGGALCPAVCEEIDATCTSEPLAAGTYTVEYGS